MFGHLSGKHLPRHVTYVTFSFFLENGLEDTSNLTAILPHAFIFSFSKLSYHVELMK